MYLADFIDWVINLCAKKIPTLDIGSANFDSMVDSIQAIVNFLVDVNFIVPLGDIFTVISCFIALEIAKLGLFAANWVICRTCDLIP